MGASARAQAALAGAVALLGLLELGFHFHFSTAAPPPEAWAALGPVVRELAAPGTLVVVAPHWAEPSARAALGSELMPLGHVARPDESAFSRALEVSVLGAQAPELTGWQLVGEREHGAFRLRSFSNPAPAQVTYDFVDHVAAGDASVRVLRRGGEHPCPWGTGRVSNGDLGGHPTFPKRRFSCGGQEWAFVGVTVIEDPGYRPRQCIWAHPASGGTLEIHFDGVQLGTRLRGHGGLPWLFEREWRGAPIELEVLVGGQSVGTWVHRDGEGWKPFEFSTAAFAGQELPVDFRVKSRRLRDRQFCFQADAR